MEAQWNKKQSAHQCAVWSTTSLFQLNDITQVIKDVYKMMMMMQHKLHSQSLPSIPNIMKYCWRGTGSLSGFSGAVRKPLARRLQLVCSHELSVYDTADLWLGSRKMRKNYFCPWTNLAQKEVPYFLPISTSIQRSISYFSNRFLQQYSNYQTSNRSSSRNRFLEWWMLKLNKDKW